MGLGTRLAWYCERVQKHSQLIINNHILLKQALCPVCNVSLSWFGCGVNCGHNVDISPATAFQPADTFETGFPAELQGQAWYHGWISQENAVGRLNKVPYHCFLIRENDQKGSNLSLSMKHQGGISHFLIEKDSDEYEIIGTHSKFMALLQLVDFYMTNSISGDSRHQLSSPCPRPSPDGECNGGHDSWQVSGDSVASIPGLPLQIVLTMI